MIDDDERLLVGNSLGKYFRRNVFCGYSLKQHHFSTDAGFRPDLPVRLFRAKPWNDGRRLRWFGKIHEHVEFAVNEGPGMTLILQDPSIAHIGYLTERVRTERFGRNYPLMRKDEIAYPNRLLQKHLLMRDKMIEVNFMIRQTGNPSDP